MRLLASDPDTQTLVNRIESGVINLQPDFQRGEVWGLQKKKRLVDSILRDWHVPPIHVILIDETRELEVLDGQQRLVAIRDFVRGEFAVDGFMEPKSSSMQVLDGLKYCELPQTAKRIFDQFAIRMFTIVDYEASEPGELFYRLNQPTNLTAAEQRNAYFGTARKQIKELVKELIDSGIDKEIIGFSNSRMAYNDVLSKFCFSLDCGTLNTKITASTITAKYRDGSAFSEKTYDTARKTLKIFIKAIKSQNEQFVKLNKATFFSWLCFISSLVLNKNYINEEIVGNFILDFEFLRNSYYDDLDSKVPNDQKFVYDLIDVFNDRASSRVADVSSVKIRDFIIWYFFYIKVVQDNISIDNNYKIDIAKNLHNVPRKDNFAFGIFKVIDETWGSFR
jgi:hypothetical protein